MIDKETKSMLVNVTIWVLVIPLAGFIFITLTTIAMHYTIWLSNMLVGIQ